MKKFDFTNGKFLGGLILIVFGIILAIENNESFPFCLLIFFIAIILIGLTIKQYFSSNGFIDECSSLITKYENCLPLGVISCKEIIIEKAKSFQENSKDFSEKSCNEFLSKTSFLLLTSGEYHLQRGKLNDIGVAPALETVFEKSTKWLFCNGYLTEKEYNNINDSLKESIKTIG